MAEIQWIKLKVGMFDGNSFKRIKRAKIGGVAFRDKLTAVWFELLDLAGKSNRNGYLFDGNGQPFYSFEEIATMIDRDEEEVNLCMNFFINEKMIETVDGMYCVSNFMKHQNSDALEKIMEKSRERQARFRERKKASFQSNQQKPKETNDAHLSQQHNVTDNVTDNVTNNVTHNVTSRHSSLEEKELEVDSILYRQTDGVIKSDELNKESNKACASVCEYACVDDNKQVLGEYIEACDRLAEDSNTVDEMQQIYLSETLKTIGKIIAKDKTISVCGKSVAAVDILTAFKDCIESGANDELLIRTIKEIEQMRLDGKIKGNQEGYLISTLYNRIKIGGTL